MLDKLIYLSTNLFTIRRWNNRPLLEINTEAGNSGFSMHVAVLMAFLEKDMPDISSIIIRMILKDLPKCLLADVSVETKRFIQIKSPDLWKKTYLSAVEDVLKLVPEEWREEFAAPMLDAKDNSKEGEIIKGADLLSAYIECDINRRVFPEYFEEPFQKIKNSIIESTSSSLLTVFNSERLLKYLCQLRSLIHAVRWNQYKRNVETSVAGHTFFVTFISFILLNISQSLSERKLDKKKLLLKALFHDVPESITGDIISPTKKRVPGFEELIGEVEKLMVEENLIKYLPENFGNEFKGFMLNPFGEEEGKAVRAADLFGSLFECLIEKNSGNSQPFFKTAYDSTLIELKKLNNPEVDYLIKWGIGG